MNKEVLNWHKVNYVQAQALLKDDKLIWSPDFDQVRLLIADIFSELASDDNYTLTTVNYLAEKLLEEENNLEAH